MIVCPVCEHVQAEGPDCEVCGRALAGRAAPPSVPGLPVDGLEPTRAAPVAVRAEAVPELEPTHHRAVVAPPEPALEVEPTRARPVDADAPLLPDLERTGLAIPGDARTAPPALLACRYCRTPAAPGERLCSRCGMRLPVFVSAAGQGSEPREARVCGCGARVRGGRCPGCGARAE